MKIAQMSAELILRNCGGDDLSVVNAARVSFAKESDWEYEEIVGTDNFGIYTEKVPKLKQADSRLIEYLADHNHRSPFNHAFLSFRCKAPIFLTRQLVKHEYMPWNEESRRYIDEEPEFWFPDVWRKRAIDKKQGSTDEALEAMYEKDFLNQTLDDWIKIDVAHSLAQYKHLLEIGVAPEQARMILPQNMMVNWIWSGTLGAFLKMLLLRQHEHAQKEARDFTKLILDQVAERFPESTKFVMKHGWM